MQQVMQPEMLWRLHPHQEPRWGAKAKAEDRLIQAKAAEAKDHLIQEKAVEAEDRLLRAKPWVKVARLLRRRGARAHM